MTTRTSTTAPKSTRTVASPTRDVAAGLAGMVDTVLPPWVSAGLDAGLGAHTGPALPFYRSRALNGMRFPSNAAVALNLLLTATPKRGPRGLASLCKKQVTADEITDSAVHALVLAMRARRAHLSRVLDCEVGLGEIAAAAAQHFAPYPCAASLCFELAGHFLLEPHCTEARITAIGPHAALATTAAYIEAMAHERGCAAQSLTTHLLRQTAAGGASA